MTRNIERRVEVSCPIFDPLIQQELRDIFDSQWNDNVKARILDKDLTNSFVTNELPKVRAQQEIYTYLKEKHSAVQD